MKKIVCFGLCFLIVLSSFVLCFADGGSPVILPVGDSSTTSGLVINFANGDSRYFFANKSPVYLAFVSVNGSNVILTFSDSSGSIAYWARPGVNAYAHYLNSQYDGYYYNTSWDVPLTDSLYIGDFDSIESAIDYIDNTVFSTTFDLTYIVDGSVSWLSSMAQAAKNNGLLLFLVTVSMVGVGIGLFNRFRR